MRKLSKSSVLKVGLLVLGLFAMACPLMAQGDIVVRPPYRIIIGDPSDANAIYVGAGAVNTLSVTGLLTHLVTISATPASSERIIRGEATITTATTALGGNSLVGVRGAVTVNSGSTLSSGYLYGVQGKVVFAGTSNTQSGGGIVSGVFGQLDVTGGTITNTGLTAAGAFDIGGTGVGTTVANVHGITITNSTSTVAGSAIHIGTTSSGFTSVISIDDVSNTLAKSCTTVTTEGAIAIKIATTVVWVPYSAACT